MLELSLDKLVLDDMLTKSIQTPEATEPSPEKIHKLTLYPSTNGKYVDLVRTVRYLQENNKAFAALKSIDLIGTVKLHGCHADIVIDGGESSQSVCAIR